MKKLIAVLLTAVMLLSVGVSAMAEDASAAEWDASVPTEITEDVQAVFDKAMEGLLGVNYTPVAVLGQLGDSICILCKASTVYPDAKPYNALVYISIENGSANITDIRELQIDPLFEDPDVGVEIDYGTSELFTAREMDCAVDVIMEEFTTWEGCEMHKLQYGGDECSSGENTDWLNSLDEGHEFTDCIEFVSEFHSPAEAYGAWEPDTEYTGWQWWLGRADDGNWELVTWGY